MTTATILGYQPRRRGIGLTALIDVVFILLMFFMLTSSFNQWHAVNINGVVSDTTTHPIDEPQILVLREDLSISLQEQNVRFDHYQQLAPSDFRLFSESRPVIIVPEPDVTLQDIVSLMDRLKAIGVFNISYGGVSAE